MNKKPIGRKRAAKKALKSRGRPSLFSSRKERDEATRQRNSLYQTSEEYKEWRKQRYAEDPVYRAACQRRAREFALVRQADKIEEYSKLIRASIRRHSSIGKLRRIIDSKDRVKQECLTFSVPEIAEMLHRPVYVVRGWINSGRFPAPRLNAKGANGVLVGAYSTEQACALALAAAHNLLTKTAHLTATRNQAIVAFARAM